MIWISYARNDPPNFNQAFDLPEIGGKSTGMGIDEFTDTPSPYLSVKLKFSRNNSNLSRVKEKLLFTKKYFILIGSRKKVLELEKVRINPIFAEIIFFG